MEWFEFKENNAVPEEIGQYISALANSAALIDREYAYIVWGVADQDHQIVGTKFDPKSSKKGNEDLESWLSRYLQPKIHFRFYSIWVQDQPVVILEIPCAFRQPVRFQGESYIRIGSYKKRLYDYPEKERILWHKLDDEPFESRISIEGIQDDEVVELLDYSAYFSLFRLPHPTDLVRVYEAFEKEGLIERNDAALWNVTNLGAMLFARDLGKFSALSYKLVRVVLYEGKSRYEALKDRKINEGYGASFESVMQLIDGWLPSKEVLKNGRLRTIKTFPEKAVRELVANAIVHQDFSISGAHMMVEIFEGRIEITNPGAPLVEIDRLVDAPPCSRNKSLSSFFQRLEITEGRGRGWDSIVLQCELNHLPIPRVEIVGDFTRITLFGPKTLSQMSKNEKLRAVYFHACLRYVNEKYVTNTSVRERFDIPEQNSSQASRLIAASLSEGLVVPDDEGASRKMMRYMPWWAKKKDKGVEWRREP